MKKPVEYFYFDMDTNQFHNSQRELTDGKPKGALLRATMSFPRVLISCGSEYFTEKQACRAANKVFREQS